jgi:hypothetical protein
VPASVPPSLCDACRFARRVESRRGSVFLLCRRSEVDPRFPRYPRLPVIRCAGFERVGDTDADSPVLPEPA